eukprot:TRINITY_DN10046_c0_g1_i1.p1 TRINITY_DN10046_c0_g1~~TRINITY_DN10046_c0_g1_i1.p1  ORF type:complete len:140 (+),score=21.96 TRINITY_DN10046_c0_g1_i1:429-848(+)
MFVLTSDFRQALAWLLVEYVVAEGWVGPTLAAMYDGVPPHARGTAQGAFSALIAIGTLAPIVVGLRVPPNGDPGPVFLAVVAFSLAAAGVLFVFASFPRRPPACLCHRRRRIRHPNPLSAFFTSLFFNALGRSYRRWSF